MPTNRPTGGYRPVPLGAGPLSLQPGTASGVGRSPALPSQPKPLPRKPADIATVLAETGRSGPLWVASLDGGVGRTTVALVLASLLGGPEDVRGFMDLNPIARSKTPAAIDKQPTHDPATWAWSEPCGGGFSYLAGHIEDPVLETIADEFDTLVYDLPARIIPLEWTGCPILVTRGDQEAITRLTEYLTTADAPANPIVVVNEAVTHETTRRARHLTVGLSAWARVVRLADDPALRQIPYYPKHVATSTRLAAAQIASNINERQPS